MYFSWWSGDVLWSIFLPNSTPKAIFPAIVMKNGLLIDLKHAYSFQFCRIKQLKMADTADVDFDLSDISVFSPENDLFVLAVLSSLSLLGIYLLFTFFSTYIFQHIIFQDCSFMTTFTPQSSGAEALEAQRSLSQLVPSLDQRSSLTLTKTR